MPSNKLRLIFLAGLGWTLAGCMSVQPIAFPIGERREPKPPNAVVSIYRDTAPDRAFEPVARLNVHIEKTFLIPTAFNEAKPKLEELARQHGADALINIQEKKSRLNETFIYNVSATAIAFTDEVN